MKQAYPHLAARVFDTPLMLHPGKAQVIASVVRRRMVGERPEPAALAPDTTPHAALDPAGSAAGYQVHDGIAVVPVTGTLVHRSSYLDAESGLLSYASLRSQLEEAVADPDVRAILLDIDSPGGEVAGCFDLAAYVRQAAQTKPVWSVAADDAYSAAYALAAATQRIYVSQTGGVGSIGVIAIHLDHSQADAAEGLRYTVFRGGRYKAEHNGYEPLTPHAAQSLQQEIDRLHGIFVDHVASSRGLPPRTVLEMEAQTYHGSHALEAGLADFPGTLDQALSDLGAELEARRETPQRRSVLRWAATSSLDVNEQNATAAVEAHDDGRASQPSAGTDTEPEESNMPPTSADSAASAAQTAADGASQSTPTEPQAIPTPAADNVVDLESVRSGAATEAFTRFRQLRTEVRQLCTLAGLPERVDELLDQVVDGQLTLEDVRQQLLDARAQAEETAPIASTHDPAPTRAAVRVDVGDVYARLNRFHRQAVSGR